ncbi:MAG TPA: hypothetical protein VFP84_01250, partial [Kofleriaceae bacterium]|nr:hypothetical protein [Kofleriaceae bacterium]
GARTRAPSTASSRLTARSWRRSSPPADAPANAPSPATPTAPAPSQTPERCTALRAARKWQDLLACGKALSDQGVANGADVQQIAQKELKNERVAREIQNKITSGSWKDARTALRQLPQDSVYVHELGQVLERAELAFVQEQARQANSLLAARECNALSDLLSRLTTSGDSAGRAAAEVNAIYAKCVTAAAPVITASSPPPPAAPPAPRPGCEPALIDDWTQQAVNQFSNGYAQSALALVVRAVNCKPDVRLYRFAATFACAAHNVALAKLYFGKVPPMFQPAIEAKCQQEHIDLASAASGE